MLVQISSTNHIHVALIRSVRLMDTDKAEVKTIVVETYEGANVTLQVAVSLAQQAFESLSNRINTTYTAYYKLIHPSPVQGHTLPPVVLPSTNPGNIA